MMTSLLSNLLCTHNLRGFSSKIFLTYFFPVPVSYSFLLFNTSFFPITPLVHLYTTFCTVLYNSLYTQPSGILFKKIARIWVYLNNPLPHKWFYGWIFIYKVYHISHHFTTYNTLLYLSFSIISLIPNIIHIIWYFSEHIW